MRHQVTDKMAKYAQVIATVSEAEGRLDDATIEAELRQAIGSMEDTQERKALVREAFDTVFGVLRGNRQPIDRGQFLRSDRAARAVHCIERARQFLEAQYYNIIESKVRSNAEKANAGAIPNMRSLIHGFLNLFDSNFDPGKNNGR